MGCGISTGELQLGRLPRLGLVLLLLPHRTEVLTWLAPPCPASVPGSASMCARHKTSHPSVYLATTALRLLCQLVSVLLIRTGYALTDISPHCGNSRCAKCQLLVEHDTNLLLSTDGRPVCENCSYVCASCGLSISHEAIVTGQESYHADCFRCKTCNTRIEELVFAKTAQGIYWCADLYCLLAWADIAELEFGLTRAAWPATMSASPAPGNTQRASATSRSAGKMGGQLGRRAIRRGHLELGRAPPMERRAVAVAAGQSRPLRAVQTARMRA